MEHFIKEMSKIYEVIVYTASMPSYANPLLDRIDPKNYITHRLFREHCTLYKDMIVKDLSRLGRDLGSVIIVDNSPVSYYLQPENAIPITTWIDDPHDTKLPELEVFLKLLVTSKDVRVELKGIMKADNLDYIKASYELIENREKYLNQQFKEHRMKKTESLPKERFSLAANRECPSARPLTIKNTLDKTKNHKTSLVKAKTVGKIIKNTAIIDNVGISETPNSKFSTKLIKESEVAKSKGQAKAFIKSHSEYFGGKKIVYKKLSGVIQAKVKNLMLASVTKSKHRGHIKNVKEPNSIQRNKSKPSILYENNNLNNINNLKQLNNSTTKNKEITTSKAENLEYIKSYFKVNANMPKEERGNLRLAGNNEKFQNMLSQIKGSRNSKISCSYRPVIVSY